MCQTIGTLPWFSLIFSRTLRRALSSLFYRWENWVSGRWSSFPKVSQLERAKFQNQITCSNHHTNLPLNKPEKQNKTKKAGWIHQGAYLLLSGLRSAELMMSRWGLFWSQWHGRAILANKNTRPSAEHFSKMLNCWWITCIFLLEEDGSKKKIEIRSLKKARKPISTFDRSKDNSEATKMWPQESAKKLHTG